MPKTQLQCPPPASEPARLVAVRSHEMPDGLPDLEFDATARVAAAMFGAPMAFVALVDAQRLWFKASVGIDVQHLERDLAKCLQPIVRPEAPLVIEDLRGDARLRGNPLVTGAPLLRFYAGAPVVDAVGSGGGRGGRARRAGARRRARRSAARCATCRPW